MADGSLKPPDDFILIANPVSGRGSAKYLAEKAHIALTKAGHQGQLVFTSASGDAKQFAHEAASARIRYVIACGGDGTLHEVVNGIATMPDITLGVLPCGRGNDFAAAVGIPRQPEAAIANLLSGSPTPIDLGCCYQNTKTAHHVAASEKVAVTLPPSKHYFITIATCGYDAQVSRRTAQGIPLLIGKASYVYAAVETLFYYEPPIVRLEGDFGHYEGALFLVATGITNRYGGGFKIVPNARINDGLFDVCIIRPVSSLTVLRLLVTLFWGGHVLHPAVSIHQTHTLIIETDTPTILYADGETMCETPATIEIIKNGLVVMSQH